MTPAGQRERSAKTRGHGFRPTQDEAMGSGYGTHDLRLGNAEPIASAGRGAP